MPQGLHSMLFSALIKIYSANLPGMSPRGSCVLLHETYAFPPYQVWHAMNVNMPSNVKSDAPRAGVRHVQTNGHVMQWHVPAHLEQQQHQALVGPYRGEGEFRRSVALSGMGGRAGQCGLLLGRPRPGRLCSAGEPNQELACGPVRQLQARPHRGTSADGPFGGFCGCSDRRRRWGSSLQQVSWNHAASLHVELAAVASLRGKTSQVIFMRNSTA